MKIRREILKDFLRWLGLAIMAVFAASNFYKRQDGQSGQSCTDKRGLADCRRCGLLGNCTVPRALSVKNHLKSQKTDG